MSGQITAYEQLWPELAPNEVASLQSTILYIVLGCALAARLIAHCSLRCRMQPPSTPTTLKLPSGAIVSIYLDGPYSRAYRWVHNH